MTVSKYLSVKYMYSLSRIHFIESGCSQMCLQGIPAKISIWKKKCIFDLFFSHRISSFSVASPVIEYPINTNIPLYSSVYNADNRQFAASICEYRDDGAECTVWTKVQLSSSNVRRHELSVEASRTSSKFYVSMRNKSLCCILECETTYIIVLYYYSTLAEEAEKNMEAVQPPLFLRFINLLMNDAVFLLDESLSNMAQLRQMLQARYFQIN